MTREQDIQKFLDKWQPRLGLSDWVVTVKIRDRTYPNEPDIECCIEGDVKYKKAILEIWKEYWNCDEKYKELNIIHQLCHLILWRLEPHLASSGNDALEEVTQSLAVRFYAHSL